MSKKVYCLARFEPREGRESELFEALKALEPDTLREDGCLQYIVTRRIENRCAGGNGAYPIVFNEIWADLESFEAHCNRKAIRDFFETHCLSEEGAARAWDVNVYTDEPEGYDAPQMGVGCE